MIRKISIKGARRKSRCLEPITMGKGPSRKMATPFELPCVDLADKKTRANPTTINKMPET